MTITIQQPAARETLIATLQIGDAQPYRLYLLPQTSSDKVHWFEAKEFVEAFGGDLPNSFELALLRRTHCQEFHPEKYWGAECEGDWTEVYAHTQDFGILQLSTPWPKADPVCYARGVRRVIVA